MMTRKNNVMTLVSDEDEDAKDTEPILSRATVAYRDDGTSSSSEAGLFSGDIALVHTGLQMTSSRDEEGDSMNVDQPQCRICLDTGGEDLIAPCCCRGTQKFVHRSCLDNWRAAKEGFAFAHCTECRATFYLRANVPPDRWWSRLKFQLLVIRDHTAIFVIVQVVVALLGMLVYKFYGEELREMFGYEQHPYGFYLLAGLNPRRKNKGKHFGKIVYSSLSNLDVYKECMLKWQAICGLLMHLQANELVKLHARKSLKDKFASSSSLKKSSFVK